MSENCPLPAKEISFLSPDLIELIRATLTKGASFRFKVKGFSMSPFIKDEDIVTLSSLSISPVKLGTPVAFVCPRRTKLVIHRVVAKKGGHYLIKGDSVFEPDCLTPRENILGCVSRIERDGRGVVFSLKSERVVIAFLSRLGLLPLIFSTWRMIPSPLRRFIKCRVIF